MNWNQLSPLFVATPIGVQSAAGIVTFVDASTVKGCNAGLKKLN